VGIAKKQSGGVRFLLIRHSNYSAIMSKKNTLLQTAVSAILPTGLESLLKKDTYSWYYCKKK